MTNKTFWRPYSWEYSSPDGEEELYQAILRSNLTTDEKVAVLGKMTSYDSRKVEEQHYVRESILRTMLETGRPMRATEIMRSIPNKYTCQKVVALLRNLKSAGLIKREEVYTGKTIVLPDGEFQEKIAVFSIVGA